MASDSTVAMPPPAASSSQLALQVVEGPDLEQVLVVNVEHTVGTSSVADWVLSDRSVSRRHLIVSPGATGVRFRDAGSRNGTWIGECRVHDAELPIGAELRIGGTRLKVVQGSSPASESAPATTHFGRFVGSAPSLRPLYQMLKAAAASDATILIEGESGTGKELLSEAIHEHSPRASGPLVVVDCGAIPENLIESELFGHVRGSFTGAHSDRAGAFEAARGGTLFLDEIGELPLAMQSRLLRALDARRIRRVGSSTWIDVDIRVVAATNRNLEREVEDGRFRLDLFHRLAVLLARVPPLRDRPEDLDALVPALLKTVGGNGSHVNKGLMARLRAHDWPGNVRELRNYLERYVLLGEADLHGSARAATSMEDAARSGKPFRVAKAEALARFTEAYVDNMLERHGGNVSHAAEAAGVARRHFQRLKSRS